MGAQVDLARLAPVLGQFARLDTMHMTYDTQYIVPQYYVVHHPVISTLVWLGLELELASVRLYYTAPYRFDIDVLCTIPYRRLPDKI